MPDLPHAPPHRLFEPGAYMVTGSTYGKVLYFRTRQRLDSLHDTLLGSLHEYGWCLQAWAVFPNHYHVVAFSPSEVATLRTALSKVHTLSAIRVNEEDRQPGRRLVPVPRHGADVPAVLLRPTAVCA